MLLPFLDRATENFIAQLVSLFYLTFLDFYTF